MVRFTTKKIATLTLGEKLLNMRNERRLSITEVSKHTKIQAKYLEYLENGNYAKLPADVYVKGFLRSYAVYMGINEHNLIKQYEREKGIHRNIKKLDDEEKTINPVNFSKLVITPKLIIASVVALSVLSIFFYLYREVDSFISKPRLVIIKPVDGSATDGKTTHVTGIAEKDALVTINEQPVLVNEKGEFSQDIGLQEGLNVITVRAKNRFDKETSKVVSVNANYQNGSVQQDVATTEIGTENSQPLAMEVYVSPNAAWLSIEADGNLVYSGSMTPGLAQKIEAKERISITSSKGDGTFVKLNGKDLGVLSSDEGAVKDIIFTASGREAQAPVEVKVEEVKPAPVEKKKSKKN